MRHESLMQRLQQLRGALELARLVGHWRLARRIEAQIDAAQRDVEAE
jgi:hypothetical protein